MKKVLLFIAALCLISCGEDESVIINKITFNLNPMVDYSKHASLSMLKKKQFIGQNYTLTLKNPVTGEDKIIKGSWGVPVNVTLESGTYAVTGGSIGKNVADTKSCRIQTEASFEVLNDVIDITGDNCSFNLNGYLDSSMIVIPKEGGITNAYIRYVYDYGRDDRKDVYLSIDDLPSTDKYIYAFIRDIPSYVPSDYHSELTINGRTFNLKNIYCKGGLYLYSPSQHSFSNISIDKK